ncbi:hypothetical protein FOB64_003470 [Candida albicans]|uniref:DUF155 domain-containing protein n=1 Tax=Candida albicans TaxID=5476 RepID=A0A8H6C0Q7_CANAX|nr:hypothetical protein FOB64_003470 [Candida albicans]
MSGNSRNTGISSLNNNRPTAKRSPSILVTDARSDKVKGARAPFAGQSYKKQQQQLQQQQKHSNYSFQQSQHLNALQSRFKNKYTDISVDKLLSKSSDIPSGLSRLPPRLSRQSYEPRRNIRSIPKLSQSLPSRTSKTSQKLVLIPDHQRSPSPPTSSMHDTGNSAANAELQAQMMRSRAELMPKEKRAEEFSRMTAYFICEEFNLTEVAKFLRKKHEVKPRLYDEALYVPYALPLLPGSDGVRVKSNNTAKLLAKNKYMETMINKNEQKTHLYEYYSGVETPEDANNYSMDPEFENVDSNTPFEPSEPQYFAPPLETSRDVSKHHAEMFVFEFGVIVFWNFSEIHEKNILADLAFSDEDLLINPIDEQDIETEEFHYEYDHQILRPRIYNDMITLRSADHLIKLTMSYAIAQSTKLELFETRIVKTLHVISKLPKKLALSGKIGIDHVKLVKKKGKLLKIRVDINLSSSILDTPEFFWSMEPALHPLYNGVREYLELDQRVQVLNDRLQVFLEFIEYVDEKNSSRITWMIIAIITLSLSVSLFELSLNFF